MFPTTDSGRIDHLHAIITLTKLDQQRGEPINQQVLDQAVASHEQISGRHQDVLGAEHYLALCRKPFLEALDELIITSRDFWSGQQRKARREGSPSRLHFFREPGQNPLPVGRTAVAWKGFAQRLRDGEAEAVKAGYAPLREPDVATLDALLQRVDQLEKLFLQVRVVLSDARKALADAREEADWTLRNQLLALRLLFRDRDSLARAMKRYGFRANIRTRSETRSVETTAPTSLDPLTRIQLLPFALAGLEGMGRDRPHFARTYRGPVLLEQISSGTEVAALTGQRSRSP